MSEVLFALTFIFVVAAFLLIVAAKTSLPVIPFYLLAGIVAGVVIEEGQILDLAQWGIAFLVFLFGVRVDIEALGSTGRISAGVALVQAGIVGGLGFAAAIGFGLDALNAFYFAVAAALSSSLIAVSYFADPDGPRPTYERLAESIHFVEDLLGVLIVLGLSALVYAAAPALEQFALAAVLFALALAIRYLFFHRLTGRLQGDSEVMMLVGISLIIGFIAIAEYADLSLVVGAFAAGIAIADDYPYSLELVDTMDDLEDFFTPIFFVTVGALLTVPGLETVGYTIVLIFAVLVLNPLVVTFVLIQAGFDGRTAVFTGLTLDQVSVFTLFIAIEALVVEAIARPVFDAIVLTAVVTMLAATYTTDHAEDVNRWLRRHGLFRMLGESNRIRADVTENLSEHVIVVDIEHGSSRILETCATLDRPVVVIENNPAMFETVREECDNYVFGDVLDNRVWDHARALDASLIISLTPEPDRAQYVADLDVDVPRLIRFDDVDTAESFLQRDATGVLYPYALSGERVAEDIRALLSGEISPEEFTERWQSQSEHR